MAAIYTLRDRGQIWFGIYFLLQGNLTVLTQTPSNAKKFVKSAVVMHAVRLYLVSPYLAGINGEHIFGIREPLPCDSPTYRAMFYNVSHYPFIANL